MKRFYVEPIDNLGTLDPAPPRDRTWSVMDRSFNPPRCVADFDRRNDARREAAELNNEGSTK